MTVPLKGEIETRLEDLKFMMELQQHIHAPQSVATKIRKLDQYEFLMTDQQKFFLDYCKVMLAGKMEWNPL